jgi:hypothetical protein
MSSGKSRSAQIGGESRRNVTDRGFEDALGKKLAHAV